MKIGLDARSLISPRPHGTGRNLLDAYRLIPSLRPDWQFVLYHQRPVPAELSADDDAPWRQPNVTLRQIDVPGARFDTWFQMRLPLAARQDRVDLLHFPANTAPAWCPVTFVLTVHDLIPLMLPGELSPRDTRAFERGLLRGIRRAAHIITASNSTREELRRELGVPLPRMTAIPWAPDSRVLAETGRKIAAQEEQHIRAKYALERRWLLSFSGSTPRKNAPGVLAGFARVAPDVRREAQLVLVGCEPAAYRAHLTAEAERLGIGAQCRVLGFAPHEDLPALLRGACGLLMPSRYEGFGLPILDAFASGVPVLTSDVSSMPEVAGDAAVYCDPDEPGSIAAGIERLLDPPTAARLVLRGHTRLSQFSWERTAQAMCAVYEMCLHMPPLLGDLAGLGSVTQKPTASATAGAETYEGCAR